MPLVGSRPALKEVLQYAACGAGECAGVRSDSVNGGEEAEEIVQLVEHHARLELLETRAHILWKIRSLTVLSERSFMLPSKLLKNGERDGTVEVRM